MRGRHDVDVHNDYFSSPGSHCHDPNAFAEKRAIGGPPNVGRIEQNRRPVS
jgi:hypothetical protein